MFDADTENLVRALIMLLLGLPLVFALSRMIGGAARRQTNEHRGMILQKLMSYGGTVLLIIAVLGQLGFDLTVLLTTAGVATVAVGFAAQTSLSNLISGIFLLVEKPFQIGDIIRVGGTTGIVHSIDLMSIKLRTFDNLFIRIPNETMIKSEVTNITRFPIRRMDITLRIGYRADLGHVMRVLEEVADANTFSLDEPRPLILVQGFGEVGVDILLGVWFEKSHFLDLRNSITRELKERLQSEDIEIALPTIGLRTSTGSAPLHLRLSSDED